MYTRNQIIQGAFRLVGVGSTGETLSSNEVTAGAEALNQMMKAWQAQGIHLWKIQEAALFLETGKSTYLLGSDHATLSYTQTELDADASSTDTTIEVESATGISASDTIGVVLDTDAIHWTTVGGISGTTVTLDDALPEDANSGDNVYVYTTKMDRPLKVHNVRIWSDERETQMLEWARSDYMIQPAKEVEGTPTQWYYSPQLGDGKLYIWPTTNDVNKFLVFDAEVSIPNANSAGTELNFPEEWAETIKWNLASRLAVEYGLPAQQFQMIESRARESLDLALGWDQEDSVVQFAPDFRY